MALTFYIKTPGADKATSVPMAPVGKAPRVKVPAGSKVIILDENHNVVAEVTQEAINNDTVIIAKSGEQAEAVILEGDNAGAYVFDSTLSNWPGLSDLAASAAGAAEGGSSFVPYVLGGLGVLGAAGAAAASSKGGDNAAPTFLSGDAGAAVLENAAVGTEVYTAQARDTESAVTFSLKPGSDPDLAIDPTTGRVTLRTSPDFEAKPVLNFVVLATDVAGNVSEKQVSLNVTNLDEDGPAFTSGASAAAVAENSGAAQVVYTAAATDMSAITYSLKAGSDAGLTINASTGAVTLTGNPNYEAKSSYSFTVIATDASGNASEKSVSFNINNADEVAPTISSGSTAVTINENSGAGQLVYTAAATDPDFVSPATANSITYSLKAGSDAGLSINPSNGRVTLTGNPDYETKSSYSFTVVATDASGKTSEKVVSLAIGDVIEDAVSPTVSAIALTSDNENSYTSLNAGDKVTLTVTMDENTIVNTTGGTPRVAINIGGTTVYATYLGGSGSKNLTFEYTVLAGQNDANGISIASNSIDANGGTLKDAAGNIAVLTNSAVADNASYIVDNVAPVATIDTVGGQPSTTSYAKFEAPGITNAADNVSNVLVLNPQGDFVLTYTGTTADGSTSIFVQRCAADGTAVGDPVVLDASVGALLNLLPNTYALGDTGKYVVAWVGYNGPYPASSLYVQIFNADGSLSGEAFKLDGTRAITDLSDGSFDIAVLNGGSDFVVTWYGANATTPYASSIWVQLVQAGDLVGAPVPLDGVPNNINGKLDGAPFVAAVGTDGSFVVTWYGMDDTTQTNDYSVFAQKFGPDGQPSGALQTLEGLASDQITQEFYPRIAAVGQDGSYVITWAAYDGGGDLTKSGVYVQKFAADGTAQGAMQRLDGVPSEAFVDNGSSVTPVGTAGMYVVTWTGNNSAESQDTSVYVQLFNADGTPHGAAVKLDGNADLPIGDAGQGIVALGDTGAYALWWMGYNSAYVSGSPLDTSIFVQKFNADGSLNGAVQKFDAHDAVGNNTDQYGRVAAVGIDGDFLLTWTGKDAENDYSVYVSKAITTPAIEAGDVGSSNEAGSLYLVLSTEAVTSEADILALSTDKFNEQTNGGANVQTALDTNGLGDGDYKLYAVDLAGNLSTASEAVVTVGGALNQIVFLLAEGNGGPWLDGGDGLFDGGANGGDDVLAVSNPNDPNHNVDFANNSVLVEVLGIPAVYPLNITGFGSDDRVEIHLSTMQDPFGSFVPNIPSFNQTQWTRFQITSEVQVSSGDPGYLKLGVSGVAGIAGWYYSTPRTTWLNMKLGIAIATGSKAVILGYGPDGYQPEMRPILTWSETSNTHITSNEVTVLWPEITILT